MNRIIPLLASIVIAIPSTAPAPDSGMSRFANPPAASRILKIIHPWPDQAEAQDRLIQRLKDQGFGGVVCNVSFQDYLESEPKWKSFTQAVQAAKEAGLSMWLYDERGYPSANAGGLVLRDHPEWQARGLLIADLLCEEGAVELRHPPGQRRLAAAFPIRQGRIVREAAIDLTSQIADGMLRWSAPTGSWHVMIITEAPLFEGTHAALNLHEKIPYPNLLQPEPTRRFLELTHERYAKHLGPNLGRYFEATFTDEPSLMSLFLSPMPYRVLPWSSNLPAEFGDRRGYDIEGILPSLVAEAGAEGRKHRHDFWKTVAELVSENFFGQIQDWCRKHNIPSGGHLLMEENLVQHVPLYGDFFRCARRLDAPGIDCLTSLPSQVPWSVARLMSSVAELEQRTLVMSETSDHSQRYRPPGDERPVQNVSEAEIRGTCNRLMVGGINRITSYYSFAGLDDAALCRLNEWVGRCSALLTGGHQVADVAMVYPVESIWPRFKPARHMTKAAPAASRVEHLCQTATETLYAARRDFTFIDSQALLQARVEEDTLVHGHLRWRVVVLPGADTLPRAAWGTLDRFVRNGGILIALGSLPANSDGEFPSPHVLKLARQWFGNGEDQPRILANAKGGGGIFLPDGTESMLATVLDRVMASDVRIEPADSPVRLTHRRVADHEVYLLINDSSHPWQGRAGISGTGPLEVCDPATGNIRSSQAGVPLPLDLGPYGAVILRLKEVSLPERRPLHLEALPTWTYTSLPGTEPILAFGEFVQGSLEPKANLEQNQAPAWYTSAKLTKGETDTYLFVRLPYPRGLDLSQAQSLVFDTWVPENQQTPNELLVILHEKGGGDYLASTGRALGAPGHARIILSFSQFKLAGWSQDADGALDRKQIEEIRLGWGGYLGTRGERVEFGFALPQITSSP